mmetsp:Transcript_22521/g.31337  ORF Transcript_22521/g.31337 Transcript_22521/m.31337 type:complete len:331 (+) Transcript_22521:318-1310(+)
MMTKSRREALLQFAGVFDVRAGVLGTAGELNLGGTHGEGREHVPGRRTGSIWMYKKRQRFPYAWQRRLFVLLPTELRLRYFKEDEDALVACGCVDLRSLRWGDSEDGDPTLSPLSPLSQFDPASPVTPALTSSPSPSTPDRQPQVEDILKFEARQIDKRRTHSFELKALKDKKDKALLQDLIRDRLEHAHVQPSLGISYALDNELRQKLAVEDKGVLVVQTWEDGPCHQAGLLSYVAARKNLEQSKSAHTAGPPDSKIGDIIQAINKSFISNPKEMFREIRKHAVGDRITMTVKRGEVIKDFVVELGAAQSYPDSYNIPIGCRIKINKGT